MRDDLKAGTVVAERRESGSEFQTEGAEERKDRSPNVLVEVRGLQSVRASDDERSILGGVYIWISTER